jgi:hypothetical protein
MTWTTCARTRVVVGYIIQKYILLDCGKFEFDLKNNMLQNTIEESRHGTAAGKPWNVHLQSIS